MNLKLKRKWTIHILHHTHLDIGYTHTQDEVMKIQKSHLHEAFQLIEQYKNKPTEEQFRWNPEITWAVDDWIKTASKEDITKFKNYVQQGFIGLDGLYGNILTGLCRPEELMASFRSKQMLEKATETIIDSAMITDIPGWTWGFVTTLQENGIRYLSIGPNGGHRIGRIREFDDKPFYWVSPSNQEKVLVIVHGKGYSWFHKNITKTKDLSSGLNPKRLYKYLKQLENNDYPYNDIIVRYNIGQDNGPTCDKLSDIATEWNQKYPHMKLNITTTSAVFKHFEEQYQESIPHLSGDITPYWEDGALSTSKETALAREAGERMTQAETLASMQNTIVNTTPIWNDVFLYNEHTWGAYNSISKPDHPFAISQWEWKKSYALRSYENSQKLLENISQRPCLNKSYFDILNNTKKEAKSDQITIQNTHSFKVSQVIVINTHFNGAKCKKQILKTQPVQNGLAIYIEDMNAYETKYIELFHTAEDEKSKVESYWKIDEKGLLSSYQYKSQELIQDKSLNDYVFQSGRQGRRTIKHNPDNTTINVVEDGQILTIIQVEKNGYKTNHISTRYVFNHMEGFVYIENIIDRPKNRRKEGIHFAFPFNIPDGQVRYDTQYGACEVEKDQLDGSNKNFITFNRWFDVSNANHGVTVTSLDAPIFKIGRLFPNPGQFGNPNLIGWKKHTIYSGTVYSYIMNNYWVTNYKADQPGKAMFRYVVQPHNEFDVSNTHKHALTQMQSLLIFDGIVLSKFQPLYNDTEVITTMVRITDHTIDHRLFNTSNTEKNITLTRPVEVVSPQKQSVLVDLTITLQPQETVLIAEKRVSV